MLPLVTVANDDRRPSPGPAVTERRLKLLERQRAKLVVLATCWMSKARKARLRQKIANVDEMIRLMKRIGLH
jgi:hypothetical protein